MTGLQPDPLNLEALLGELLTPEAMGRVELAPRSLAS